MSEAMPHVQEHQKDLPHAAFGYVCACPCTLGNQITEQTQKSLRTLAPSAWLSTEDNNEGIWRRGWESATIGKQK